MGRSRVAARLVIPALMAFGSVVGVAGPASAECIILPNEDSPEASVCVDIRDDSEHGPQVGVSAEVYGIAGVQASAGQDHRPRDYVEVCFWSIATSPTLCLLPQ